jgi:tRNA-dihydrouridine synthase B
MKLVKPPFNSPFILAPMLEPNDYAFRLLCKKAGAGAIYTGMVSPMSKQELKFPDKPILQIFGNNIRGMANFIKKYDSYVSGWDFNLGCPSVVAKRVKIGSYLQDDLVSIEKILKEIRKNTSKFFSVKIRKSSNSFKILNLAEKYCDAIIIHPRTREQGYSGKADISFALELKEKSKIPVILSGDVCDRSAKDLLKLFDYLMVGRAAIGNPSIFYSLRGKPDQISFKEYLNMAQKFEIPFKQIKYQAFNFTKGLSGASRLRSILMKTKTTGEIESAFKDQILQ